MKKIFLSLFAKIILSVLLVVVIFSCFLTIFVKVSEKRVISAVSSSYMAKPVNGLYSTDLEGGYWQLESVVDTLRKKTTGVSIKDTDTSLSLISELGASYAYSYKDGVLASFWPMSDAFYVMSSWDMPWYNEYLILQTLVPDLKEDNKKLPRGKYSESYSEFCEALGCPLPCIAMTGLKQFYYDESAPTQVAPGLVMESVNDNTMVLVKGKMRLIYKRSKSLPYKIAPISIYYQEQILQNT